MKKNFILFALCVIFSVSCIAQSEVKDQAVINQEQRMVFQQWDQNKFKPSPGFLSLNPYYWLVWGLFHPGYHKTDLRPLSANGPQTQRIAFLAEYAGRFLVESVATDWAAPRLVRWYAVE